MRSLDHKSITLITIVLFPNIFYFLIGILSVFVTWRRPLRLCSKAKQPTDNKTNMFRL